jgi:hypothetical protein
MGHIAVNHLTFGFAQHFCLLETTLPLRQPTPHAAAALGLE